MTVIYLHCKAARQLQKKSMEFFLVLKNNRVLLHIGESDLSTYYNTTVLNEIEETQNTVLTALISPAILSACTRIYENQVRVTTRRTIPKWYYCDV